MVELDPIARPRRALVVDDNVANRYYAGKILRQRDYDVTPAQGYYEALKVISSTDVDLLLSDIRLGTGSGIVLARLAKNTQPTLTVLLMTAYIDAEIDAGESGWPVIRIPFGNRDLIKRLQHLSS